MLPEQVSSMNETPDFTGQNYCQTHKCQVCFLDRGSLKPGFFTMDFIGSMANQECQNMTSLRIDAAEIVALDTQVSVALRGGLCLNPIMRKFKLA
jgi:hypothetical protein